MCWVRSTLTLDLLEPRRSRRIAGLLPEPTDMTSQELDPRENNTRDGGGHCTRVASVWPHQREPRTFSGKADEDVEEWLKHYQRVSKYNRWDQVMQLANVVFYLAGTALLWFENHEEALATWEQFVEEIKQCFGDSISKKKKAEQTLAQRAQIPGETCTTYIEEVLKLCSIVCPQMSEEDKVGHLLKGIAEDVYNFLITKEDLASAADVVRHCRAFETLKTRRITPKFGRLANVTTVASLDISATEDIAAVVRRIVREELDQQFQKMGHESRPRLYADPVPVNNQCALQHAPPTESAASWIRPPVRDHCSEYHADVRTAAPFQPITRHSEIEYDEMPRQTRGGYYRPRGAVTTSPGTYRAATEAPTCYNCGLQGHIARFCQRRQQRGPRLPPRFATGWRNTMPYFPAEPFQQPVQPTATRHGSPASDRSLSPQPSRQARSPSPRRRLSSPPLGN